MDFSDQALAWNGGGYHWTQMVRHSPSAGPGDDVDGPLTTASDNALRLLVVFPDLPWRGSAADPASPER